MPLRTLRLFALPMLTLAASCDDAEDAPVMIELAVTFTDALTADVLAGVELCVPDHPEVACATSDASGRVAITLPGDSELMLKCQSATHGPGYMTWAIGRDDIDAGEFGLIPSRTQELLFGAVGGTDYTTQGALTVNVYDDLVARDTWVAGATMTIAPASGVGPTYVGENMLPSSSLDATSTGGPGVFAGVTPGSLEVTLHHPDKTCAPGFGWPADAPLTLRTRIFAGGVSNVTFVCASP